jgi:hypothetical protein
LWWGAVSNTLRTQSAATTQSLCTIEQCRTQAKLTIPFSILRRPEGFLLVLPGPVKWQLSHTRTPCVPWCNNLDWNRSPNFKLKKSIYHAVHPRFHNSFKPGSDAAWV